MASKIGSKIKKAVKKVASNAKSAVKSFASGVASRASAPPSSSGSKLSTPKAVTAVKSAVKSYASGVASRASAPSSPGSNLPKPSASKVGQKLGPAISPGSKSSRSSVVIPSSTVNQANRIKALFPASTQQIINAPSGETERLEPPERVSSPDATGIYTGASQTQVNPQLGITADDKGTLTVKPPEPVEPEEEGQSSLQKLMESMGISSEGNIPRKQNVESLIQESEAMKQRDLARQEVQNYTNQINQIVNKAEADKLSLIGQGRGIPEVIIGGQQAQISREAAIQSLPIQALLSNAQGNLEIAQDHLDSWTRLIKEDAQNDYDYETKVFDTAMKFATLAEQRQFDALKTESDRKYNEKISLADKKSELMASALQQGAPSTIYNAIKNAGTYDDAIIAAGRYGMTALESAQLQNIQSQIAERANANVIGSSFGVDEKTMTKLQVAPEYKTITGVLPAIQTIKRYQDAISKWGSGEVLSSQGRGELKQAYGDAIVAWKSLATLGALSGADFALAENVIPNYSIFKREGVMQSQLSGALNNAVSQTEFLTKRLGQNYPTAKNLLNAQIDDILVISYPDKYKYGEDGQVYELTN